MALVPDPADQFAAELGCPATATNGPSGWDFGYVGCAASHKPLRE
jgi:hypothetical protein